MAVLAVGSRSSKHHEGITFFHVNDQVGSLTRIGGISSIEQPTFQCFNRRERILYSVSETDNGSVSAYAIDDSYTAELLFTAPSGGDSPCHLALSPLGDMIAVSNYGSGDFTLLSSHGEVLCHEHFEGVGFDPIRQEGSHIHCSLWSADGSYLYVADLGLDRIIRYAHDRKIKEVIDAPKGSGPRHMALGKDGLLYVASELSNEILVYRGLVLQQRISTLPQTFLRENTVADLHLSRNGAFLYCSNRGHDSIAIFKVNQSLHRFEYCYTDKEPRNFTLSHDGSWLFVANGSSSTITVHRRNTANGSVGELTHRIHSNEPVCLTWI